MKLVTVLMLVALPLYCYAGPGCAVLEDVVEDTIDPALSMTEYLAALQGFVSDAATAKAVVEVKQCFLNQSNETLANYEKMTQTIYESFCVCSVLTFHKIFGSEDYREWSETDC